MKNTECESTHLADMISEDGLILSTSDLPLEPGLGLSIVGNLQCCCTIANLGQIRHGVSNGDGPVDSSITPVGKKKQQSNKGNVVIRTANRHNYIKLVIERFTLPSDVTEVFLLVYHHTQRTSARSKHVQRLRIARQLLSRSSSKDDCPAASLGNTVLTSLIRKRH